VLFLFATLWLVSSQNMYQVSIKFSSETFTTSAQLPNEACELLSGSFRGRFNGTNLSGGFVTISGLYSFADTQNDSVVTLTNDGTGEQSYGLLAWFEVATIQYQVTSGYIVVNNSQILPSTLYYYENGDSYYFASTNYDNIIEIRPSFCTRYDNFPGAMSTPCGGLLGCGRWTIDNDPRTFAFPQCSLTYFYLFDTSNIFMKRFELFFNNLKSGNFFSQMLSSFDHSQFNPINSRMNVSM